MTTSLAQAACNALGAHLRERLGGGVVVSDRWPAPGKELPKLAVTILLAGEAEEEDFTPHVVARTNGGTEEAPTVLATWALACLYQPAQLDVWAHRDVALDQLLASLAVELRRSATGRARAPFASSLTLALGDGWPGYAEWTFRQADRSLTPGPVIASEWRATIRAEVALTLTAQAESYRMACIALRSRVSALDPENASGLFDVIRHTAEGLELSREP